MVFSDWFDHMTLHMLLKLQQRLLIRRVC